MKNLKIYFSTAFLLFSNVFFAQDVYDKFIEDVGMIKPMVNFVNNFIDDIEKAREERPDSAKWKNVKESMDYSYFITSVLEIFKRNYTEDDIRKIYADNEKRKTDSLEYKPKPGMAEELYDIGRFFGGTLDLQIQTILGENVEKLDNDYSSFKGINSDQLFNKWTEGKRENNITMYFVNGSKKNMMYSTKMVKNKETNELKSESRMPTEFYLSPKDEAWNEDSIYYKNKFLDERIGKYIITKKYGTLTILNFLDQKPTERSGCKSSSISKLLFTKPTWKNKITVINTNCFE